MVTCVVVLALVNTASAMAGPVHKTLQYQCESPGQEPVTTTAEVDMRVPDAGTAGTPIGVSDLSIRAELPAEVATGWRGEGATAVEAQARLDLTANQAGRQSAATSTELAVPSTAVPESGALPLATAAGSAPLVVEEPGETSLLLGNLVFRVTPRDADGAPTGEPDREVRCTPVSGADTAVTVIPVAPGEEPPTGEAPENPRPVPPDMPRPLAIEVTYDIKGASRTTKLESDIKVGPGELVAQVDVLESTFEGELRLPPSPGYFVMFDFMPSTATVDFLPAGPVLGVIESGKVDATSELFIRLRDVTMADVPIDVGPRCRTITPAKLELKSDPGFNPLVGGTMRAVFTIPPFSGCGVTEPLDDLFTGVVSGVNNTVLMDLRARL